MLTARSFLAWLLVSLSVAAGIAAVAHSLVDGAAVAALVPAGLISLLPRPEKPAAGEWRVTVIEPRCEADILWAEDWGEPLVPYRLPGRSTGTQIPSAADPSGQVRADHNV